VVGFSVVKDLEVVEGVNWLLMKRPVGTINSLICGLCCYRVRNTLDLATTSASNGNFCHDVDSQRESRIAIIVFQYPPPRSASNVRYIYT
jgi:hypothetical protein